MAALVGQTLSHYALDSILAKGATGVVFRARDVNDGQVVAFKALRAEFAKNEEDMQRFVRGMKTVLPLRHPNLVTLLAAGKTGAYCWMAMEYVEGESMTQVIQRLGVAGMLDWRYGYRVAVHIARALDYAHSQSIIHRNVTPANILFRTEDKTAKLGDLMLAKALEGNLAQQITRPGELVGDVAYMAPERTRGAGAPDGPADLYGLGATVYAQITGRPPFSGSSVVDLLTQNSGHGAGEAKEIPDGHARFVPRLGTETVGQAAGGTLSDGERITDGPGASRQVFRRERLSIESVTGWSLVRRTTSARPGPSCPGRAVRARPR